MIYRKALAFVLFCGLMVGCKWSRQSSIFNESELLLLDMVHNNPAEELTHTSFNSPEKLNDYGYDGQVINDFKFIHTAITFDTFDPEIFPKNSESRKWVEEAADDMEAKLNECHEKGLLALGFVDIIVLPEKIVEKYGEQICDSSGKIDIHRPLTQKIHRYMISELFDRFPQLDGLVIRTGETYLFNVPYHTGNSPISQGPDSHIVLLDLLRDEVCVNRGKLLIYRTWDFGFFHTDPDYYLEVTNRIEPHSLLYFSIKHTQGDYHRTFPFNPTLSVGNHQQLVEVQCQREYEGKGAHPNYIAKNVIEGFEECLDPKNPDCLSDLLENPNFKGVWTWSRGGGWVGPYINNELWCDLNAFILSQWTKNPERSEIDIFNEYSASMGFSTEDALRFRKIALLSSRGVLLGHNSLAYPVNVWWTRDQFFGGLDLLEPSFDSIISHGLTDQVIGEKEECLDIWQEINTIAGEITTGDSLNRDYIKVSSKYGLIKYSIVCEAWKIMLKGLEGDRSGEYDWKQIMSSIRKYDTLWSDFEALALSNSQCATLYQPYSFVFEPPHFHGKVGMDSSIDQYREKYLTRNHENP